MSFELHERLAHDCATVTDLALCRVLVMNDRRFPWCILVPMVNGLRDLHDVPAGQRLTLFDEIDVVSRVLSDRFGAQKINVAALGNQVPQLHVHVIGRQTDDAGWPAPVWSAGPAQPYEPAELVAVAERLRDALEQ